MEYYLISKAKTLKVFSSHGFWAISHLTYVVTASYLFYLVINNLLYSPIVIGLISGVLYSRLLSAFILSFFIIINISFIYHLFILSKNILFYVCLYLTIPLVGSLLSTPNNMLGIISIALFGVSSNLISSSIFLCSIAFSIIIYSLFFILKRY